MELKQNPFSFYDFLGYLTPGSIFLYGVLAGYAHVHANGSPYDFIVTNLSFEKAEIYIPFIFFAYIIGHILSFLSSVLVEKYSIWSDGYPSKYLLNISHKRYFDVDEPKCLRGIIRGGFALILLPILIFDVFIGRYLKFRELYAKPLDSLLISIIRKKLLALMIEHGGLKVPPRDAKSSNTDFFRYVYHYAVENAPNHLPKMQNYVALYGFLRTLTLLSVILFWAMVWHVCTLNLLLYQAILSITIPAIVSYVLYMSFVKFYRRFSLEALMALAVTYKLSEEIVAQLDGIDEKLAKK